MDGTSEIERIPAEIWRKNELEVTKVFVKEKVVAKIILDPFAETADTQIQNNVFPKIEGKSRVQEFKEKNQ